MEVITIDSSDEDDDDLVVRSTARTSACLLAPDKRRHPGIASAAATTAAATTTAAASQTVTQNTQSDNDNSSVSSSCGRAATKKPRLNTPPVARHVSMDSDDDDSDDSGEEELEIVGARTTKRMGHKSKGMIVASSPCERHVSIIDGESDNRQGGELEIIVGRRGLPLPITKSNHVDAKAKFPTSTSTANDDEPNEDEELSLTTLPPEIMPPMPLPINATWRVILLMDHREFGCSTTFLQETRTKINNHFKGVKVSDIESLPSADYMFVARLYCNRTPTKILDERVLDTVIERKEISDLASCVIAKSKKCRPLSFFDAQMFKFQQNGISNKLFLMEGDEDGGKRNDNNNLFAGANSKMEKMMRLKRVKTTRLQLERGEWEGVNVVCTRNKRDTISYLIRMLETFQRNFDPRRPPTKTMREVKSHIDGQMKMPTFQEYLRQRRKSGIGVVKAMKVIMDPKLDWDKSFVSPEGTSRQSKSTLEDRATYWPEETAPSKNRPASSKNPEIKTMAAAIAKCQQAVKEFDVSADGKERVKLDNKRVNSKKKMTPRDSDDLDELNRQRESLTLARNAATREKSDDDGNDAIIASATKALADFDASENGGKKRRQLMQKKRHCMLVMFADESAKLKQLNEKRDSLADVKRHSRPSVTESRKALREFDESAEGRERKALVERSKGSKKKMTREESAELDELNRQRGLLSQARKAAKGQGGGNDFAASDRALADFDASKAGRNRSNLMVKKRCSQRQMSGEEVAKLKALNETREILASEVYQSSSTDTNGNTSFENRKEPPERIIKRPKVDQKLSKKVAKTNAAKRNSTSIATTEEEVLCGICSKSIDIWVDEDIVLCNRVAACGATFHKACLAAHNYDINVHDGCVQCQTKSKFTIRNGAITKNGLDAIRATNKGSQVADDVIVLESDDEEKEDDDDVIVID